MSLKSMFPKSILLAATLSLSAAAAQAQNTCAVSIFFPNGGAGLGPQDIAVLDAYANSYAPGPVTIYGYADATGGAAANLALSQARANAVAARLMARGMAVSTAAGRGETTLPGTTGPTDPANRRVEVGTTNCTIVRRNDPLANQTPAVAGAVVGGIVALGVLISSGTDTD
ncbi:OmpA family protein [Mesobacterium pallidum]|uniref:OmpA family protein n=1 Tax=Mesobacterium pallidum TaxID=2872037 RepID=UPI001EE28505|nr:OmpA family protein [Mesobacterium pallidum]